MSDGRGAPGPEHGNGPRDRDRPAGPADDPMPFDVEFDLEPVEDAGDAPDPPPEPVTFQRQPLASTVRWVWFGGYLIPVTILTVVVLQLDLFVLGTPGGLVTALALVAFLALALWRTITRYRAWSWELTERELIIDRGVVFELTRIVPRVRIQHVDISSGPLDRFFGLRQLSIYTAGTREADASIPGLTEERAEELRSALIGS